MELFSGLNTFLNINYIGKMFKNVVTTKLTEIIPFHIFVNNNSKLELVLNVTYP